MKLISLNRGAKPSITDDLKFMYEWEAEYEDGTVYRQFTDDNKEVPINSLNFSKVIRITIHPTIHIVDDSTPTDVVSIEDVHTALPTVTVFARQNTNERLIKFWQRTIDTNSGVLTLHREVLGIQKTVNGVNVKFFVLISQDNKVVISTTDDIE